MFDQSSFIIAKNSYPLADDRWKELEVGHADFIKIPQTNSSINEDKATGAWLATIKQVTDVRSVHPKNDVSGVEMMTETVAYETNARHDKNHLTACKAPTAIPDFRYCYRIQLKCDKVNHKIHIVMETTDAF